MINQKVSIPSLADYFDRPERMNSKDLDIVLSVYNNHFNEIVDVDLPLYQCTNCKKLVEIKRGDNNCKYCDQYIYWGEV